MSATVKSHELRNRLADLDLLLARGTTHTNARPIPAKVFEGDDAVFGSRG